MKVGDHVAVWDARACRWCSAVVICVDALRATVVAPVAGWCGIVRRVPELIRPIRVVQA